MQGNSIKISKLAANFKSALQVSIPMPIKVESLQDFGIIQFTVGIIRFRLLYPPKTPKQTLKLIYAHMENTEYATFGLIDIYTEQTVIESLLSFISCIISNEDVKPL